MKQSKKQEDFLRTIERYWEQSLLRLLLQRKAQEIHSKVSITEEYIKDYYAKMQTELKVRIVLLRDEALAKRLTENPSGFRQNLSASADSILEDRGAKWYLLNENPTEIEKIIFLYRGDKDIFYIAYNDEWMLFKIEERRPVKIASLKKLRETIINELSTIKERQLMQDWVISLRRKAKIEINKESLNSLFIR